MTCIICGREATRCHGSSCEKHAHVASWTENHAKGYEVAKADMDTVHVVYGRAGSYEDYHEWSFVSFEEQEDAESLVSRLQDQVREYGAPSIEFDDRERVVAHFRLLGFPEGVIPSCGTLEDLAFRCYSVPFTPRPFNYREEGPDFLTQLILERTAANPDFPRMMEEALQKRKKGRS